MKKMNLKKYVVYIFVLLLLGVNYVPSLGSTEPNSSTMHGHISVTVGDIPEQLVLLLGNAPDEDWNKTYGGIKNDRAYGMDTTLDDGYIITGYTVVTTSELFLMKTNESGGEQWGKTFGGTSSDIGYAVQQT